MADPIRWDGSLEALHRIQATMPDCLIAYRADEGILYVRTERNPEAPVPFGWNVTRIRDGAAVITPEVADG